ncbi:AraC family transcriptional regulator [Eubacteriaceae bacterium ES2]|nr:AraC family transcriptional regulator [Eubacteriaceae bacterium ES2]
MMTNEKSQCNISFSTVVSNMVELKSCKKSAQSYKKHMHHELSVGIIREGTTTVKFPEKVIRFKQGDGVIIPPKLSHQCSPEDIEHWHFDMLYIAPEFYGNTLKFDHVEKVTSEKGASIRAFIDNLATDSDHALFEEQLIRLLEQLSEAEIESETVVTKKSKIMCEELKDYIERHYLDRLTLDQLQKQFDFDKFAMIRNFGKLYNTSPMAYHLQLKVVEAKRRLKEQMPLLDVCYGLGFYDQAHFTKEFQKMNGLTPGAYQKSFQI